MGVPAGGESGEGGEIIPTAAVGQDHEDLLALRNKFEGHVRVFAERITEDARRLTAEDRAGHALAAVMVAGVLRWRCFRRGDVLVLEKELHLATGAQLYRAAGKPFGALGGIGEVGPDPFDGPGQRP